ncbi:chloride channel CLIC-like protein 1 [Microcaecilia unicolor]|uniref:Chloride channel CLIC-like protein 1 n=1 Tax=Microcaecilia unicolor TaxID=1415580 RepID=A0A6P7YCZ9_9AMPH|nr:chloride channel CLIC-like protein 1 [Microcaecilia unicolor]XP_030062924.1 chloride channel CLIC-like protein 1 [Microcaecilia unicolor]XP_030062925.1 chloride channel CLIC-like protein 1 [Microcaecilia unicolor]
MPVSWFFHACLLVFYAQAQGDEWVDPTDMLNYDAASGKMRQTPTVNHEEVDVKPSEAISQTSCLLEKEECQRQQESLLLKVEECNKREQAKPQESISNPVLKRYLNKILIEAGKLGLPDETNTEGHYDAEIILTRQTLSEFSKFLSEEDWKPGALDDALSNVLINFKLHNYEAWQWKFEDYFGIQPFTLFMVLLCLLCIVSLIATELWTCISWFTQLKRLLVISIILSFGWNWMYLYKVAFAKHQADMAKREQFDSSCVTKMDWSESLVGWLKASWTFQDDDPCEQYYKTLLVNPILLVPPTKALVLTYTHFVTEPLKHVGRGMGEFIRGLLNEIPMLLQIPVLILMALAVLGFCYGAGRSVGTLRHLPRLHGEDPPACIDQPDRKPSRIEFIQSHGGGAGDCGDASNEKNTSRHRLMGMKPDVVRETDTTNSLDRAKGKDQHHLPNHLPLSEDGNKSSMGKAVQQDSGEAEMQQDSGEAEMQQRSLGGTQLLKEEVGSKYSSDNPKSNQSTIAAEGLQKKEDFEQLDLYTAE